LTVAPATSCATESGNPYGCCTPIGQAVDGIDPTTGTVSDPKVGATVKPQCTDRTADKAVYCSCRCADVDGNKPSDQVFCDCPSGFTCTQLVSSIGATDSGLTGAYCIKSGTQFDPSNSCGSFCDPASKSCGHAQGL
jgi:hypothetical protein